jgi:NTE family protein
MGDYRVGLAMRPRVPLATAVAASSAYPPVLSPLKLHVTPADFEPHSGHDLQRDPFTDRVTLTDGGVYDNLGLETVWKRYQTVLISDAGGNLDPDPYPKHDWPRHALRAINIIHNQVTSLRKRQAISAFKDNNEPHNGTYWGIGSHVADYHLPDAWPAAEGHVAQLAATPTRLKRLKRKRQERLVNWGFAISDTALRKHLNPILPRPMALPYPEAGI